MADFVVKDEIISDEEKVIDISKVVDKDLTNEVKDISIVDDDGDKDMNKSIEEKQIDKNYQNDTT